MKIIKPTYQEVNINTSLKFKLTEEGLKILKEYDNEVEIGMKKYGIGSSLLTRVVDEEGLHELPLWKLMNIFGSGCDISKNPPFEKCKIFIMKNNGNSCSERL